MHLLAATSQSVLLPGRRPRRAPGERPSFQCRGLLTRPEISGKPGQRLSPMPKRKTKPASKPAKKSSRPSTPSTKPQKAAKPSLTKKPHDRKPSAPARLKAADKAQPLDLSSFPAGVDHGSRKVDLSCVRTRRLHSAPRPRPPNRAPRSQTFYAVNTRTVRTRYR